MIRPVAFAALVAALLGASGVWHPALMSDTERDRVNDACRQYHLRSEHAGNGQESEFESALASACDAAGPSLDGGSLARRHAAAQLLLRIARLHETVAGMNADRALSGAAPVTATGEFLIAHRLGVVSALEVWLDTGPGFSLASQP
jgi:hypothetical protein